MASKIDSFLDYLRENPQKSVTVEEIINRWNVGYNTAYSWMKNKYVKEERIGAKPKRVIFNHAKFEKDHQYIPPEGRSVSGQYKDAANSLSGELRTAHKDCIKSQLPSDENAAMFLDKFLKPDFSFDPVERIKILKENYDPELANRTKHALTTIYRTIEYLEKVKNNA